MPEDRDLEPQRLVDALHALMDAQMGALKERQEDLQRAVERIPVEQRAAVETAMVAAAKATDAALSAAKAAVDQAQISHAREHTLMAEALRQQQLSYITDKAQANEWRSTVEHLAADKMDGNTVRDLMAATDTRLKVMETELATTRGGTAAQKAQIQGQMLMFGAGISVVSLIVGIASVALAHLWK